MRLIYSLSSGFEGKELSKLIRSKFLLLPLSPFGELLSLNSSLEEATSVDFLALGIKRPLELLGECKKLLDGLCRFSGCVSDEVLSIFFKELSTISGSELRFVTLNSPDLRALLLEPSSEGATLARFEVFLA